MRVLYIWVLVSANMTTADLTNLDKVEAYKGMPECEQARMALPSPEQFKCLGGFPMHPGSVRIK